jgi:hypothetical protein
MKKIYLLSLIASMSAVLGFSQSQRLVLLEHFTGASCGPCATYNPAIENILVNNPEKVVSIKYQLAPPGVDPMYSHNSAHSGSRAGYYNVTGIPNSVLDGNFYNGHPANWSTTTLNNRYDDPSPFDIDIIYMVTPFAVEAVVTVTATQDITSSNLRLHTVVIEEEIEFDSAPGSNGETGFYHVMKRMLPNQNGTTLTSEWMSGDSETFTLSWNHTNVYSLTELAVVAFVQDNSTKEVHQAGFSNEATYGSPYSVAAQNSDLQNIPSEICEGIELEMAPSIKVLNLGTETINSLDIVATVNGQEFTTSWTGDLGLFQEESITLDPLTTTVVAGANNVSVVIENPNGASNEVSATNLNSTFQSSALESTTTMTLNITFDCWPQETSWSIENAESGVTLFSGGPYPGSQAQQTFSSNINLPSNGCYAFKIDDSFGDGMNGTAFGCAINGSANLTDNQGNVLYNYTGTSQWFNQGTAFAADQSLSSSDLNENRFDLQVYPNPTAGIANFSIALTTPANVSYEIVSVLGQVVQNKNVGMLSPGAMLVTSDVSSLTAGVYIVNFRIGNEKVSKKIVVRQ